MFIKSKILLVLSAAVIFISCTSNEKPESKEVKTAPENKYTISLKEAVDKFSKAVFDRDTATLFSLQDSNIAMTFRGQTTVFGLTPEYKKNVAMQLMDTSMKMTTTYNIEEVKTGQEEPVWAGYDKGIFTQTIVSTDGKYNRKVSGPYFRSWSLQNGQWKCYHIAVMAFSCEGNDCK